MKEIQALQPGAQLSLSTMYGHMSILEEKGWLRREVGGRAVIKDLPARTKKEAWLSAGTNQAEPQRLPDLWYLTEEGLKQFEEEDE